MSIQFTVAALKRVSLILPLLFTGCNASFENIKEEAKISSEAGASKIRSGDAEPGASSGPEENQTPDVELPPAKAEEPVENPVTPPEVMLPVPEVKKLELSVTVSSPSVKPGNKPVQATAKLKDVDAPPAVIWTMEVPNRTSNIGSIDNRGVYLSPMKNDKEFLVKIIATLVEDPMVKASAEVAVLIDDAIFARCKKGDVAFPILADVYQISSMATALPDYRNANEARKVSTVCMENYAVAGRNFSMGFPDLPGLFEWFSLQTRTKIIIPKEGDYTFQLNSDDGSKLYINGRLLINNDGLHRAYGTGPEESLSEGRKEATLNLKPGEYDLVLDYFQGPRYRIALELKWRVPGSNGFVYVPRESFK